jgi:hypothetical protein
MLIYSEVGSCPLLAASRTCLLAETFDLALTFLCHRAGYQRLEPPCPFLLPGFHVWAHTKMAPLNHN